MKREEYKFAILAWVVCLMCVLLACIYAEYGPVYTYHCTLTKCMRPPFHHTCWCGSGYYQKIKGWTLPPILNLFENWFA